MAPIKIEKITDVSTSDYIKLNRVHYTQKGVTKVWDVANVHDSVAILLHEKVRNEFVLVKQVRPAVYLKNSDGFTYELCAGIVDKETSLEQIAKEEIYEECGYDVPLESIERVTSFYTAVGFAGSVQTLYFAEVDESMRLNDGGGIEHEQIEVIYLPVSEAKAFIFDESKAKTPGLMFAFSWFLESKI